MSRSRRIIAIIPVMLLALAVAPGWWSSPRDYSPTPVVLLLLLSLCALHVLLQFTSLELLAVTITTVPALYLTFHVLCGLPVADASLLVAQCALAIALFLTISSILTTHLARRTGSMLRIMTALLIPFLWAFVLKGRNILFAASFVLLTGLIQFYGRSLKNRG